MRAVAAALSVLAWVGAARGNVRVNVGAVRVEEGGAAQVDIALDVKTTDRVVVEFTSMDKAWVLVNPKVMTFEPGAWNQVQMMNISVSDDVVKMGDRRVQVECVSVASDDLYYSTWPVVMFQLEVAIRENDESTSVSETPAEAATPAPAGPGGSGAGNNDDDDDDDDAELWTCVTILVVLPILCYAFLLLFPQKKDEQKKDAATRAIAQARGLPAEIAPQPGYHEAPPVDHSRDPMAESTGAPLPSAPAGPITPPGPAASVDPYQQQYGGFGTVVGSMTPSPMDSPPHHMSGGMMGGSLGARRGSWTQNPYAAPRRGSSIGPSQSSYGHSRRSSVSSPVRMPGEQEHACITADRHRHRPTEVHDTILTVKFIV